MEGLEDGQVLGVSNSRGDATCGRIGCRIGLGGWIERNQEEPGGSGLEQLDGWMVGTFTKVGKMARSGEEH